MATSLLPGLIFPIVLLTFPLWLPEIQASSYNQPGNVFREGLRGTITDSEIAIQTAKGNSSTFWTAFTHYKSTENIIMLYQNKNCFNIFTQSMFANTEDWKAFLGEVTRRLPKK
ncbi:YcxB family protein [bacterium]|nr:MAG: YcxB family protein [bacterium]